MAIQERETHVDDGGSSSVVAGVIIVAVLVVAFFLLFDWNGGSGSVDFYDPAMSLGEDPAGQ